MNPKLFPSQVTNNCNVFQTNEFKINQPVGLKNDDCFYNNRDFMSIYAGKYNTNNYYECDQHRQNAVDIMVQHPSMSFNNGYGWIGQQGKLVDRDSDARLGSKITNVRCRKQLYPRINLSQPFMGRGTGDVCVESELLNGELTGQKRQCNSLSGVTINTFVPMVQCLKENVQNTIHIIPEDNMKSWTWGGVPSRQVMRQRAYKQNCKEFKN